MKLGQGSRISIIGGGPAGCFAALHAEKLGRERSLTFDIRIFDPAHKEGGSISCKGCAGILSWRLREGLRELGLELTEEVIQEEILSYVVHVPGGSFFLNRPSASRRIVSVYRGNYPCRRPDERPNSFDDFLRQAAIERGIRILPEAVRRIESHAHPVVMTNKGEYECDFIIMAAGVNGLQEAILPRYRRPALARMAQGEIARTEKWLRGRVIVFFDQPKEIFFAAMIPKRSYANISLLSKTLQVAHPVSRFFEHDIGRLKELYPSSPRLICKCNPLIAIGKAKRCFGRNWVAVGDAAISRLYKDGIGSAYRTSKKAVETAIVHGASQRAFKRNYGPYCRSIALDNSIGRLLFRLISFMLKNRLLSRAIEISIRAEQRSKHKTGAHSRFLWGLLTGDQSYRTLLTGIIRPASVFRLLISISKALSNKSHTPNPIGQENEPSKWAVGR